MSGNLSDVQIPDATTTARGLMTPSQVVDLNEVSYRETLAAAEETVIDAADEIGFADSSSGLWKRISWTNFIEGLGSIVLDGGSQNDLLIWNDTSGQWEPATPIETKDILGLGISDSPSFSNLILNGSAPTINLGESASTDSLILSAGTSGTYDGATIFMRGANYPSDPSDIIMAVDGTISFKLRGSDKYFGFGELSPSAKVDIRGPGSDSSTFTFKSSDVTGTRLFSVRCDGLIAFKNYSWPIADGTTGQIPSTNGAGVISWIDAPAGGSGYWSQVAGYLSPSTVGDALRVGDNGYSFASDTNTLIRRSASDTIELVTGGVARATVANTGVTIPTLSVTTAFNIDRLRPTGGTTAAPEISSSGDTNTGVHFPGGDVMELVTGGVARATVATTGVTIPTLTVTTLTIDRLRPTGGTTAAPEISSSGDTNTGVHFPGGDVMELVTGGVARATVANTGVTIPTLSVTTAFNIDRLKPTGGTTALPEFSIPGDTNTGVHLATLDTLELVTAAQPRITISGNDISIGMDTADYVAFFGSTPVARQAELTDELVDNVTAITHTSPTTPDYAIQDLTDTGGFGFATKDEGNTVLAQIRELQLQVKNLRTRNIQLEDKLVAYGLLPDTD